MSGKSGVKYDAVPKDEIAQNTGSYGATDLQANDPNVYTNPFTGFENMNGKFLLENNGKENLQATETSFSQAVRVWPSNSPYYNFPFAESLSC